MSPSRQFSPVVWSAIAVVTILLSGCGKQRASTEPPQATKNDASTRNTPDVNARMAAIVAAGPGIHSVKTDSEGKVISFIACGQSAIWNEPFDTPARALAAAEEAALWDALAQAAAWLSEQADVSAPSDKQTETAFSGNCDTTLRGFQTIHVNVDPNGKFITVLIGWHSSAKHSEWPALRIRRERHATDHEGSEETYTAIFVNGVKVIEEESRVQGSGTDERGHIHRRQWRASGIPYMEVIGDGSESGGMQFTTVRGFRESGAEIQSGKSSQ
jgi:hypothetical protein